MGIKSPINIKILNDTLDIVTLMTHVQQSSCQHPTGHKW